MYVNVDVSTMKSRGKQINYLQDNSAALGGMYVSQKQAIEERGGGMTDNLHTMQ